MAESINSSLTETKRPVTLRSSSWKFQIEICIPGRKAVNQGESEPCWQSEHCRRYKKWK